MDRVNAKRAEFAAQSTIPVSQTRLPSRPHLTLLEPQATAAIVHPDKISIDEILEHVTDLPAMSNIALKVMQLTSQESTTTKEISQAIVRDPNFAARVLKLSNSAYYGLPRAVSTISDSVSLLGNRTIRSLAIIASTQDALGTKVAGYDLDPGDLWRHSLACAMSAQMIAEFIHYPDTEEAFIAGLLHDVGKVIMGIYVKQAIEPIRNYMEQNESTFLEAENAILGFDHAEVGGRVAKQWNLPIDLCQSIAWHHEPVQNGNIHTLAAIVHAANAVCLSAGIGLGSDGLRTCIDSAVLERLHLTETVLENVLERLVLRISESQPLFELQALN